jgi:hypothetical protein
VETNKDRQLQRRVQSLQRFLMTRLKAELAQRSPPQPSAAIAAPEAAPGERYTLPFCDATCLSASLPSIWCAELLIYTSEAVARAGEEVRGNAEDLMQGLEQLFAVVMRQKMQCVGRESASKEDESISYQVLHPQTPRNVKKTNYIATNPNTAAQYLLLQP